MSIALLIRYDPQTTRTRLKHHPMKHFARIVLLSAASVFLTGCSVGSLPLVYQVEVQQGNIITEEMVTQLRPGMSKRQVRHILGTPAIEDIFHDNRWDYVYTRAEGGGGEPDRLTAMFDEDGNLVELEGNLAPDNWAS